MKLMLFLGAGVSIPSGLPSVDELTDRILNNEYNRHTCGAYESGQDPMGENAIFHWAIVIQKFLHFLKSRLDAYKQARGAIQPGNYEEIWELLRELGMEDMNRVGNVAIQDFEIQVRREAQLILNDIPQWRKDCAHYTYRELLSESQHFIHDVVCNELWGSHPQDPIGFDLVRDLATAEETAQLDIVTLNYDFLLERFLDLNHIDYADGFGPEEDGIRRFPRRDGQEEKKIRLLKPHGSLDWRRWAFVKNGEELRDLCIVIRRKENEPFSNEFERPVILMGTISKAVEYGYGYFREIYTRFLNRLYEHNLIVMSGYGWNDRGMNNYFREWLEFSGKNRILVFHEYPGLLSTSWWRFEDFCQRGQIVPFKKWLCDTSLQDLMNILPDLARER